MELRDYLRMLKRGWVTIVLVAFVSGNLALLYVLTTPKQYTASATIEIWPSNPDGYPDLSAGGQFAVSQASAYAAFIDSSQVLQPLVSGTTFTVAQLQQKVTAVARKADPIIDITVVAGTARDAENIADATVISATAQIPKVSASLTKSPLLKVLVVKTAKQGGTSVSPGSSRIVVVGLAVGLALGFALTLARQALDTRLRLAADLGNLSRAPVLAVVPKLNRRQRSGVLIRDDSSSLAADSYRSLRTNLTDVGAGARGSMLLVAGTAETRTSAQVAINLAWSIAQAGRRVILIDLDMRRSSIGAVLGLSDLRGMADVLAGEAELAGVVQETSNFYLHAVLPGTSTLNPADLLSSPSMERALRQAEVRAEFVVVHVPPLLSHTDAAVVAMVASRVLVSISAGHTRSAELTQALGILKNVRVEPVGFVMCGTSRFGRDFGWPFGARRRNHRSPPRQRDGDQFKEVKAQPPSSPNHRSESAREADRTSS